LSAAQWAVLLGHS